MATIEIKDRSGKKVGTADVSDDVFGIEPHPYAMHQVVRSQLAGRRSGSHSTQTRSDARGGGRKPWRQKGTGRARAGTIRAPQWKGGGVVFGPHPRSHGFRVPNKVVKLAMRSALSAKTQDGVLFCVDDMGMESPSTKQAAQVLQNFGIDGRVTVVVANDDETSVLSFRNLPQARVITASEANTYDLVDNTAVLFTQPALVWIEEVLV